MILKEISRNTASFIGSLPRVNNRSGTINIGNVFSHITLKKRVCDFSYVVWFLFYNLLKFDVINADVPFSKRGHNLETEAKLNKARHPFWNEVSLFVGADFQLIHPRKTRVNEVEMFTLVCSFILTRKRRKTFHEISMIRC